MSTPLVIGLDIGTTSAKAVAVDTRNAFRQSAAVEYRAVGMDAESAEQDVDLVWRAAAQALQAVMRELDAKQVAGVCLSGAMHSVAAMTEAGEALTAASTWKDDRPFALNERVRGEVDTAALYDATGCPVQWVYHPVKLRWLAGAEPRAFAKASRFAAIRDVIAHRLTGVWATDAGLASTTGLLDRRSLDWHAAALRAAGVEAARLPALVNPGDRIGAVTAAASPATGLPQGAAVLAGGSDGALANLGANRGAGAAFTGRGEPATNADHAQQPHGECPIVVTLGTSGAVRRTVAQPLLDPKQRTWCYHLSPNRWVAGGAINNGGLAARWVYDAFYRDAAGDDPPLDARTIEAAAARFHTRPNTSPHDGPRDEMHASDIASSNQYHRINDTNDEDWFDRVWSDASRIAPGVDGLIVQPYLTGERSPHWRADLPLTVRGLTASHRRAHLARAALEGVAMCVRQVWDVVCGLEDAADARAGDGPPGDVTGSRSGASSPGNVPGLPGRVPGFPGVPGVLTGGITRSPGWAQMLTDVLGAPLAMSAATDASALGAAIIGHWGLGHLASLDVFAQRDEQCVLLQPDAATHAMYEQVYARFVRAD